MIYDHISYICIYDDHQVNGFPLPLVALLPVHLQHPPHPQQHGRVTGRPRGGHHHHHEYNDHDDDGVNEDDDDGDNQGGDAGLPDPPSGRHRLLSRVPLNHRSHHCRNHH